MLAFFLPQCLKHFPFQNPKQSNNHHKEAHRRKNITTFYLIKQNKMRKTYNKHDLMLKARQTPLKHNCESTWKKKEEHESNHT